MKTINKIVYSIKNLSLWEKLFLIVLLAITLYTRFYNLGYSDYIGDEHKAFYQPLQGQTLTNFFMEQRKGPLQFVVSYLPYLVTHNFRNELAERIPFAAINVAAVILFYFLVKKLSKNRLTAVLAAFLLSINGFIVGFGRIAQYQNLNLLFSFLALYFYLDLLEAEKKPKFLKSSLLGTLCWSLSFLAHWDAIFIFAPVLLIFIKFLRLDFYSKREKTRLLLLNFFLGCLILLPFLIPYTYFQMHNQANKEYFSRRVELGHINFERYLLLVRLYNPFVLTFVLFVFGLAGIFFWRETYLIIFWFLFNYAIFEVFVRKPGTHIYNFVVPLLILAAVTFSKLIKNTRGVLRYFFIIIVFLLFSFLFYQTSLIFIDHRVEYPRDEKVVLNLAKVQDYFYAKRRIPEDQRSYTTLITPEYTLDEKLPLFGFPHKRYWNEINDFINEQNSLNNEDLGYITNEDKTVSEWYMDAKYNADGRFYIIGIRKPFSFVDDNKFPQIGGKETVWEVPNEYGETVATVYLVGGR